jgi:hypothetical protein
MGSTNKHAHTDLLDALSRLERATWIEIHPGSLEPEPSRRTTCYTKSILHFCTIGLIRATQRKSAPSKGSSGTLMLSVNAPHVLPSRFCAPNTGREETCRSAHMGKTWENQTCNTTRQHTRMETSTRPWRGARSFPPTGNRRQETAGACHTPKCALCCHSVCTIEERSSRKWILAS